ncbi:MAG: serine hydrolase domain-containing protein [Pseudomonadota bacterium]
MSTPAAAADDGSFEALLAKLDQLRVQAGVAGGVVLISSASELKQAAGFGVTDWESESPMHPDVFVRIGSVTKGLVGLTFLKLQAEGRLTLTDTLAELKADTLLDNPWQTTHPITLAQLLEHTAGLTDMVRSEWDHNKPLPLTAALKVAPESRRLKWPPGLQNSYSNSGAGVAVAAVEGHLGINFENYFHREIAAPLGMPTLTFDDSAATQARLIAGYDRDGRSPIPYWHVLYRPFGGLNVKFSELARYLQLLLGQGQVAGTQHFSKADIARAETPTTTAAARQGLTFGYGLGNYQQNHKGFVFHGHGGDADGYLTHCAYNRDAGLGFCLLINAFQNRTLRQMKRAVMDYVVAGLEPKLKPGQPQPLAHLRSLTGDYEKTSWRFPGARSSERVQVTLQGSRLYLQRSGETQHLVPQGRWQFRRRFEPVATIAFIPQEGGLLLQGPFGNFRRAAEPTAP